MPDELTFTLLSDLRADLVRSLSEVEIKITVLEYAVLDQTVPMTAERLGQLQRAVRLDSELVRAIRDRLEKALRPVPEV